MTPQNLGQRICIIGQSSTGKSTLAVRLGKQLNLPVHHLDTYCYKPGTNWEKRPHEDFIKLQNDAIAGDKWVIEGNYHKTMPGRFFRADTIIKTEMNRFGCVWRFIRRTYRNKNDARTRIGTPNNMPYNLNWSAIWLIIRPKILYPGSRSKINLQKELFKKHKDKLITLRSFAEINNLCPVAHTKLRPHIHPE